MARRKYARARRVYAKSRRSYRRGSAGLGKIKTGAQPFISGIGAGLVAEALIDKFVPQLSGNKALVGVGAAYYFGGMKGAIGKVAFDAVTGRPGILNLTGLLGGSTTTAANDGW